MLVMVFVASTLYILFCLFLVLPVFGLLVVLTLSLRFLVFTWLIDILSPFRWLQLRNNYRGFQSLNTMKWLSIAAVISAGDYSAPIFLQLNDFELYWGVVFPVNTFSWFLKSNSRSDFCRAETGSGAKKQVVLRRGMLSVEFSSRVRKPCMNNNSICRLWFFFTFGSLSSVLTVFPIVMMRFF